MPAAAGGWIFSWDLSRVSVRDVKDVSRISAKTASRFARLTLSPTYKHNTLPSNETRVHILTARRIGVQEVRLVKKPPGGHFTAYSSKRKIIKLHFLLNGETVARKGEKNNRNDTSCEGLRLYHLLPLRP